MRSLAPKEHGAYGQLALPLLAALLQAWPTVAGLLLALSFSLAFTAHEPVLVLLGHRGARALQEDGERARRRLLLLGVAALFAAAAGVLLAPLAARLSLLLPAALALLLWPLLRARLEKSLTGELLAAFALSATALPVALADGVALPAARGTLGAWWAGFAASTVAVRGVIARQKGHEEKTLLALAAVTVAFCAAGLLPKPLGPRLLCGGVLVACAWAVQLAKPHPRELRRLGWILVGGGVATTAVLLLV
jgi:YwiC-like protein